MQLLSKEQILTANDLTHEDIEVPEWGGRVRVRMMTGTERDQFEEEVFQVKGKDVRQNLKNFRTRLLVRTIINEDGSRMFTDKEIEILGQKAARPIDTVFAAAQRINGMGAKDVEEMTKNSESAPNESSTSD